MLRDFSGSLLPYMRDHFSIQMDRAHLKSTRFLVESECQDGTSSRLETNRDEVLDSGPRSRLGIVLRVWVEYKPTVLR